jgi:hypothetical protein
VPVGTVTGRVPAPPDTSWKSGTVRDYGQGLGIRGQLLDWPRQGPVPGPCHITARDPRARWAKLLLLLLLFCSTWDSGLLGTIRGFFPKGPVPVQGPPAALYVGINYTSLGALGRSQLRMRLAQEPGGDSGISRESRARDGKSPADVKFDCPRPKLPTPLCFPVTFPRTFKDCPGMGSKGGVAWSNCQ